MHDSSLKVQKNKEYSGSVKEMTLIAFPMIVSYACDMAMIFVDRIFLSKLGSLRMNAALGGGMASFLLGTFFLGLVGYSTVLVAQYFGSKQKNKCAIVVTQGLLISLAAYPLILCCKPLILILFQHSGIDPRQLEYQCVYFNIIVFSAIFMLLRSSLSGFFCGIGKTKVVMFSAGISMVVNIILNYLLIFGKFQFPALGIKGAAIGTVVGSFVGVLILFVAYLKKKNVQEFRLLSSFIFNKQVMGKLLRFGYPSGVELFINFSAFTGMMFLFHAQNAVVATASTIMINWDMVSFVPLLGVEIGVMSLVGRYMGAGKPSVARRSTLSGLKIGSVYSIFVFILFMFFPEQLVNLFRPDIANDIYQKAFPIAVSMLRIACLYVLLETVICSLVGALRGAGDTFWAMCLTVGLHISVVLVEFICLKIFNFSVEKTWFVMIISFFLGALLIYLRYASGRWQNIKVVDEANKITLIDGFHET